MVHTSNKYILLIPNELVQTESKLKDSVANAFVSITILVVIYNDWYSTTANLVEWTPKSIVFFNEKKNKGEKKEINTAISHIGPWILKNL